MSCIELKNVSYKIEQKTILDDISFHIKNGSMSAIIGPNGAGKSTLAGLITSVLTPSGGKIYINGKDLSKMSRKEIAKNIAVVPSSFETNFDFTVFDIVLMARYAHNKRSYILTKEDILLAEEALIKTNAIHLRNNYYKTLSSGEKQTVLLARAFAQNCPIILLDEPTSNLDIKNQMEIMRMLKEMNDEKKCILAIMHDINLAIRFIENYIILKNGKLVCAGNIDDIFTEEILSDLYDINIHILKDTNRKNLFMQAEK
jgi:iron complex transport system ATP-binding protein